jgi:hypothetical protein
LIDLSVDNSATEAFLYLSGTSETAQTLTDACVALSLNDSGDQATTSFVFQMTQDLEAKLKELMLGYGTDSALHEACNELTSIEAGHLAQRPTQYPYPRNGSPNSHVGHLRLSQIFARVSW